MAAPSDRPVRAFVAVDLPEAQRGALAEYVDLCRSLFPAYRWVPPASLHLTLRFLGYVDWRTLGRLRTELGRIRAAPFKLSLDGRGTFGSRRSPRVVWVGVHDGAGEYEALAGLVEAACQGVGLEPETRPLRPHVTIARSRPDSGPLGELPEPPELAPWSVDEFVLYESVGGNRGPVYRPIQQFPLGPRSFL